MPSGLISNMKFAKGLCSTTSPADEFLFGSDTAKRVKEMAELTKQGRNQRSIRIRSEGQRANFPNPPQSEQKTSNPKPRRNWYVDLLRDV